MDARVFVAFLLLSSVSARAADSQRVTVTGIATVVGDDVAAARAAAIKQGQRLAVEQVVGALIQSEFTAKQQEILRRGAKEGEFSSTVRDQVLTHSTGFVRSQRILGEKRDGNTYRVTLQVEVAATSLHEELAGLEDLMAAVGYPKIVLLAGERYHDKDGEETWTGSRQATRLLEEALLARKVPLVAARDTSVKHPLTTVLQNPTQVSELAEASGADVAIVALTEARFGSHNDFGNNLYYVSATVNVQAVQATTGRVLASFARKARGIGINETEARENAIVRAAPDIIATLLKSLSRAWQAELRRAPFEVISSPPTTTVRIGKKRTEALLIEPGEPLAFAARGPAALAIEVHLLTPARQKRLPAATLELVRDSRFLSLWPVKARRARRSDVSGSPLVPTAKIVGHLQVPAGSHHYALRVEDAEIGMAVTFETVESVAAKKRIPAATRAASPIAWALPPMAATRELPEADERRTAKASPAKASPAKASPAVRAAPAVAAATPPGTIGASDGTLGGATRALADAVAASFASSGRLPLFHRVAIPYFEEIGPAVEEHRLGPLVAEVFAVELARREPFVVVERERLGELMAEHRMVGLGLVDQQDAAEFGRVLGAQSIISGTVSEAGAEFVVTVRQVDVESGRVLVSGSVNIQRDGLVALSSDLVVKRTVSGAAFRSALVPGWGQLYNGDNAKGWVLFGAGVGSAATAITLTVLRVLKGNEYDSAEEGVVGPAKIEDLREEGDALATSATVAWWTYGAVWLLAIADAVINGEEYEAVQPEAFAASASASASAGF